MLENDPINGSFDVVAGQFYNTLSNDAVVSATFTAGLSFAEADAGGLTGVIAGIPGCQDATTVAAGYFDPNTNLDVVVGCDSGDIAYIFGNGAGNFVPGPVISTGFVPIDMVVDDFNKDGTDDVAVAFLDAAHFGIVFLDFGAGMPPPLGLYLSEDLNSPVNRIAKGDFDLDGDADLVILFDDFSAIDYWENTAP